jgi:hypothetical protein
MIPNSLITLLQAICLVSPELISNLSSVINKHNDFEYGTERTFAYEIYRQWENLIKYKGEDMVINAEVPKKYCENKYLEELSKIFGYTNKKKVRSCFYPDLVYHHSQYDDSRQELICEIKTLDGLKEKNSPKLMTDLKKLSAYMRKETLLEHPFTYGAFILLGGNMKDIKIRYRKTKVVEEKSDRIYCITYNIIKNENDDYVPVIEAMPLYSVITNGRKYLDNKRSRLVQIINKSSK